MLLSVLLIICIASCIGSFLTMASYRLPREISLLTPHSVCPSCDHTLAWKDLVPIVSWVQQKGNCRYCKHRISLRYPLIELGAIFIAVAIFLWQGPTPLALLYTVLALTLYLLIIIDLEFYIIPDSLQIIILALGITYHLYLGHLWVPYLISSLLCTSLALTLHFGYRWLRHREGLGFGDVKLLMVMGLWLMPMQLPFFLFFAGVFGIVLGLAWTGGTKHARFPFGPALVLSFLVCLLNPGLEKILVLSPAL
jgi:leader peptidase (prepilin peptidase)/N-methyltransferase